ncbi:hypothetical protein [Amycolatopsis taiwanensis]|uniref:hypothetical protein n=1 Tax=Amycolatopsis taiwanensis TaxID=342230 RepID=UPI000486DDBF|nr:hypothetical protein [Amycolatopsis taiwanensis]
MLFIVLILVLGALGLLVTALVTAQSLWAWISIGISALAALLLVADVVRRRVRRTATEPEESAGTPERAEVTPSGPESEDDPAEEESASEDRALVAELTDEVLVVDEHPRYHRTGCSWLAGRETIPISAKEARELGFTPCGRCTPDTHLAASHRT